MNRYVVFITPAALDSLKALPPQLCLEVKRAVSALQENPAPPKSKAIDPGRLRLVIKPGQAFRYLRLDGGRIVYAVNEARRIVDVLAVRARPPYNYDYIKQVLAKIK